MNRLVNQGDPELDDLLDVLEYVRSRWNPQHVPQSGIGKRIPWEQKREYALSLARSVDVAIACNGTLLSLAGGAATGGGEGMMAELGAAAGLQQRTAGSQTSLHGQSSGRSSLGMSSSATDLSLASGASSSRHYLHGGAGGSFSGNVVSGGGHCTKGAVATSNLAGFAAVVGNQSELQYPAPGMAMLTQAAISSNRSDDDSSRQGTATESEVDDGVEVVGVRPMVGRPPKKEASVGFNSDPKWYFVQCSIPWVASRVGITVINACVPIAGTMRPVLLASVVKKEGTGHQAGVRVGDCVVKVEGRDATGLSCKELLDNLKDLLRVRKQADASMTLDFVFARSLIGHQTSGPVLTGTSSSAAKSSSHQPSTKHDEKEGIKKESSSTKSKDAQPSSTGGGQNVSLKTIPSTLGPPAAWCHFLKSEKTGRSYIVVSGISSSPALKASGFKKGDILTSVDGQSYVNTGKASMGKLATIDREIEIKVWRADRRKSSKSGCSSTSSDMKKDEGVKKETTAEVSSPMKGGEEEGEKEAAAADPMEEELIAEEMDSSSSVVDITSEPPLALAESKAIDAVEDDLASIQSIKSSDSASSRPPTPATVAQLSSLAVDDGNEEEKGMAIDLVDNQDDIATVKEDEQTRTVGGAGEVEREDMNGGRMINNCEKDAVTVQNLQEEDGAAAAKRKEGKDADAAVATYPIDDDGEEERKQGASAISSKADEGEDAFASGEGDGEKRTSPVPGSKRKVRGSEGGDDAAHSPSSRAGKSTRAREGSTPITAAEALMPISTLSSAMPSAVPTTITTTSGLKDNAAANAKRDVGREKEESSSKEQKEKPHTLETPPASSPSAPASSSSNFPPPKAKPAALAVAFAATSSPATNATEAGNKAAATAWEIGELGWTRMGKLPRWPCILTGLHQSGEKSMASIRFFGDIINETVALANLEKFDTSFKKLYRKRYEKVYVRAVSQACVHLMKTEQVDVPTLNARFGLPVYALQGYLQDAAPKMEELREREKDRYRKAKGLSDKEELVIEEISPPRCVEEVNYDIDPEVFRESKKGGIMSEAWF